MPFKVSPEVVAFAQDCRKGEPATELPQLDLSSKRAPLTDRFDVDVAQEAIGERLERWMGTLSRRGKSRSQNAPFDSEEQQGIADRLGLDVSKPGFRNFLGALHEEYSKYLEGGTPSDKS